MAVALLLKNEIRVLVLLTVIVCVQLPMVKGDIHEKNSSDSKDNAQKYYDLVTQLENSFKSGAKSAVRALLSRMMALNEEENISGSCLKSLMKYVTALTKAKLWAAKMLDATSKIPAGILEGSFANYGAFDECLDLEVLRKNGSIDFRGRSCGLELKPPLPPLADNVSLARLEIPGGEATIGALFRSVYPAFYHKQLRFAICVPSTCSVDDMRNIFLKVSNWTDFEIKVPQCYTKEGVVLKPIHIAVIACLSVLLIFCIIGTIVESRQEEIKTKNMSMTEKLLVSFSLSSNFKRLLSPSGGSTELKCIHGIRALGMCWIILGHNYVFLNFEVLKTPFAIKNWFDALEFELINNGWLSVETFFLLSGMLACYSGLNAMEKTKGKLNVIILIIRRYVRLTPPVLLLMGLVFFMPLVSSGPFWYERIDSEIESCRKYWWTTILYFSNWWGIDKGCLVTSWYLSADFQLHIFSLILLIVIFRYAKIGLSLLFVSIAVSCIAIAIETIVYNLTPIIQLSAGDDKKVFDVLNSVHIHTSTHLGPHCIGMVLGYFIYKYRERKLKKSIVIAGWCMSVAFGLSAVLGSHRISTGEETSRALAIFYAAVHRSVFIAGVGWVAFACVTGYGGIINSLLSSAILAPPSRLTFMVYLLHPLVIWTKIGSLRESISSVHYNMVYIYLANVIVSFTLAIPFYLLLEAPLSNIDRILFSSHRSKRDELGKKDPVPHSMKENSVYLTNIYNYPPELQVEKLTYNGKSS